MGIGAEPSYREGSRVPARTFGVEEHIMSMTPLVCCNDAEVIRPSGMSAGLQIELWTGSRPDDAHGRGFVWSRCSGGRAL
jgi:hypothetical protein